MQTTTPDKELAQQNWPWWPLLPLYPYGKKRTLCKELIPNQIWSFEQLQGIYYVAVPVRLIVVKVPDGLMLYNALPVTSELLKGLSNLEEKHGPVKTIVLPTASGLEHKIALPSLARSFPKANLWLCPGQWSFPVDLPLSWLGIPQKRTNFLFDDGLPYKEIFDWLSLGPLDIGLGRFQEVVCFHKKSKSLLVTDSLIAIEVKPPELFNFDPTPLLFHARERGEELILDTPKAREKGWKRIVLFASFLKPTNLSIPPLLEVLNNAFKPGLRNRKSHFGIYPFKWENNWESSAMTIIGKNRPLIQIAPVLERLVFPRAKELFINWLDEVSSKKKMRWLISSHFSEIVSFTSGDVNTLKRKILAKPWPSQKGNWSFLSWLDTKLLKLGIVPSDPIKNFKDLDL